MGDRWQAIADGKVAPVPQEIAWMLQLSDERDQALRRSLAAWREGFAAGELAREDDYSRGYTDGVHARKHALRDAAEDIACEIRRWGPAGREHYGDPKPGDHKGGSLAPPDEHVAEYRRLCAKGMVFLAGRVVHRTPPCTRACYAYEPGWYPSARAAAILASLPHDYARAIAGLADTPEAAA